MACTWSTPSRCATRNSGRWYLSTASELIVGTALASCDPVTARSTKFRGCLCGSAGRLRRAATDRCLCASSAKTASRSASCAVQTRARRYASISSTVASSRDPSPSIVSANGARPRLGASRARRVLALSSMSVLVAVYPHSLIDGQGSHFDFRGNACSRVFRPRAAVRHIL